MLFDKNSTMEENPIIQQMKKSNFHFYLTGSRRFGWPNSESDWDFFTQNTPKTILFLKTLGFRYNNVSDYGELDRMVDVVFTWGPIAGEPVYLAQSGIYHRPLIPSSKIDVQLVRDVEFRKFQVNIVDKNSQLKYYLRSLPKNERHVFWNTLTGVLS